MGRRARHGLHAVSAALASPMPHSPEGSAAGEQRAGVRALMRSITCPVCKKPMKEPAALKSCWHTFCSDCIWSMDCFRDDNLCPVCFIPSRPCELIRPVQLTSMVQHLHVLATLVSPVGTESSPQPAEAPAAPDSGPAGAVAATEDEDEGEEAENGGMTEEDAETQVEEEEEEEEGSTAAADGEGEDDGEASVAGPAPMTLASIPSLTEGVPAGEEEDEEEEDLQQQSQHQEQNGARCGLGSQAGARGSQREGGTDSRASSHRRSDDETPMRAPRQRLPQPPTPETQDPSSPTQVPESAPVDAAGSHPLQADISTLPSLSTPPPPLGPAALRRREEVAGGNVDDGARTGSAGRGSSLRAAGRKQQVIAVGRCAVPPAAATQERLRGRGAKGEVAPAQWVARPPAEKRQRQVSLREALATAASPGDGSPPLRRRRRHHAAPTAADEAGPQVVGLTRAAVVPRLAFSSLGSEVERIVAGVRGAGLAARHVTAGPDGWGPIAAGSPPRAVHTAAGPTRSGGDASGPSLRCPTHLVVAATKADSGAPLCARTPKYVAAVAAGIWVVTHDWVARSCEAGEWVDEAPFEVEGDHRSRPLRPGGPRRAREARAVNRPPLLHDYRLLAAPPSGRRATEWSCEGVKELARQFGASFSRGSRPPVDLYVDPRNAHHRRTASDGRRVLVVTEHGGEQAAPSHGAWHGLPQVSLQWLRSCCAQHTILPFGTGENRPPT